MRLLHTGDWHLGHTLRDWSREPEHRAFLAFLLDAIERLRVDVVLVAGDIFHTANPSAASCALWFEWLAAARSRFPSLAIVAIAGNHDSAARIEATEPVCRALGVRVIGHARRSDGALDVDRLIAPISSAAGDRAWLVAVPYLRRADLPAEASPIEAIRAVWRELIGIARGRAGAREAVVAMGHGSVAGARLSDASERAIVGQEGVPRDAFEGATYVALGHLHLAQTVASTPGAAHIRYAGSPLPLSMGEAEHPHQVALVDVTGDHVRVEAVAVPRTVDLIRLPAGGPGPIEQVVAEIAALPDGPAAGGPFVEVAVAVDGPDPGVRRRIDEAIAGKRARLVQVRVVRPSVGAALAEVVDEELGDLEPAEVFARRYAQEHDAPPPAAWMAAFRELADAVEAR